MTDPWTAQMEALGAYIRSQRELAHLSLRQMAELTRLSHPYLSQVERGVHQPSVRVIKAIAEALNVSVETILAQAGLFSGEEPAADGQRPRGPGRSAGGRRDQGRLAAHRRAEGGAHRRLRQHAHR